MINILFEQRLFALVGILERIAIPLKSEEIPYELIGGVAVMVHVNGADSSAVRNTKDVDIMVHKADLDRIIEAAGQHGFTFDHIRLVCTGEKVRPNQAIPNPPLRPEHHSILGVDVAVISVSDLVQMKLSNNRDIDRVHVDDMDQVGLITREVEKALPPNLAKRLEEIRGNR